MKKVLLVLSIILMGMIPGYTAENEAEQVAKLLKKKVVTKKLRNGITVIMMKRGVTPTVALEISFATGSGDESYETEGTAHMLEHMLFKGTDRIGTRNYRKEKKLLRRINRLGKRIDSLRRTGSHSKKLSLLERKMKKLQKKHAALVVPSPYDKIYSSAGGVSFNASTSRDKTGYYLQLPSDKLELWAKTESERLRHPVFRQFFLERDNVMEERRMRYESDAGGMLMEHFISTAFTAHPYRHPIIGWNSSINSLTVKKISDFYYANYTPERMTITVVGQFNERKAFRIIHRYFGRMKKRRSPMRTEIREPKQRGEKRFSVTFDANPQMIIGWHKPTYPSKDDYTFDLVSGILADGKSSRLYKKLVLEKKLVSSVFSWNGFPGARFNNMFIIMVAPKHKKDIPEIERIIYGEIESMAKDITPRELHQALLAMESDMVFSLDTNKGIASILTYYQTVLNDWRYLIEYLQEMRKISRDDVARSINTYLVPDNRTVGILTRKESK